MAVLQMQRVSICALRKDRKVILRKIQNLGVMEINNIVDGESGFQTSDTAKVKQAYDRTANIADGALAVLDKYCPEKKSMLSSLEGKKIVKASELKKIESKSKVIVDMAKHLISLDKELDDIKANVLKNESRIEELAPWMSLDVPMQNQQTKSAAMFIGIIAAEITTESLKEAVSANVPQAEAWDIQEINRDKDAGYIAVFCLKKDEAKIESALRSAGFIKPVFTTDKAPQVLKEELLQENKYYSEKSEKITSEIKSCADLRDDFKDVADYFRVRADKYEVIGTLPHSNKTFVISGYVAKKNVELLKKAVGDCFECAFEVEDIAEDENPPVILNNNSFSQSVEGVLESYGLPKKGEFDPTTIMSFFYVFFFGMMLSDAAYGAIIAIACFVILKKYPRMSEGMHKSIKMFMYCGVSTLVWGVLFGGYFGNIVDIVSQAATGETITVPAMWFVPLNDPMRLLVYSMAFGLIHLFTGLGIKGYMILKEGRVKDFFCDVVLWYAFLIGLIMLLLPTDIFASIAQTKIVFPPALNILSKVLAIGGALGLLLMSGRANKNIALRLALGAYDIYGVTSWLSDILSYSRLLALGLATGVIASVINQMASMLLGGGILGVIAFIIVFIVGHTLNLAINLLGAYVHTNRLQFVEFFGKFYEGGGKPFEPFKSNTKYVDIMEDI